MHRQVVIDDGREYFSGCIRQRCSACGRDSETRHHELERCPYCSTPFERRCSLAFGGPEVRCVHEGFVLGGRDDPGSAEVRLDSADVTDALKFMARHFEPVFDRGLPTIHDIRHLICQALAALEHRHTDLARVALLELLAELDSRRKPDSPPSAWVSP